jgi:hypothetical protein
MKTNIYLLCGIVLAFCLWLLLHHASEQKKGRLQESQRMSANQQSPMQPIPTQSSGKSSVLKTQPASLAERIHHSTSEASNDLTQSLVTEWQAPIDFYGKVVDDNTNPVQGVSVQFQWDESPTQDVARIYTTKSDADGLFSLQGQRGRSLEVSVSKEGYYSSGRDKTGYIYALAADIFSPSMLNPVIFHIRKKEKGELLIHISGIGLHTMRDYLLAADGKPTEVSLRDGRLAPVGQGDLKVEFQAGPPLDQFPSRISWQCRVTVSGGGLMETSEEFPFLAPENGYQEFDQWSITSTNWTESLDKQFYVKLRDGNFGRVKLRVIGVSKRAYFRMESFLNPSGSRNLEPAN